MTHPKRLGNVWENEVAKIFSLWVTQGKDDSVYYRDISSGARCTKRKEENKTTMNAGGDIVAQDLQYKPFLDKYYLEAKNYASLNSNFINSGNIKSNQLFNMWLKTLQDCGDKIPLMICKIRDGVTKPILFYPLNTSIKVVNYMEYHTQGICFRVCNLQEFLDNNSYEELIKAV